jgi:hypothetical protein
MLSKIELEFLKFPESFNANYAYGIKHRLNCKVKALSEEIGLLQKSGFLNLTGISKNLTENNKIITENSKSENCNQGNNWAAFNNQDGGPSRTRTGDLWLQKSNYNPWVIH